MLFMDYVQSLWGNSAPSAPSSSAGLFSSPSAHSNNSGSAQHLGCGVWPLSPQVREEMKKGTRYNMKVILRGTKGTGKSTLLARLTGHPLPISYTPSTELVASTMRLQGEHCAPNEGTKVDIWEAVEEGRQRAASSLSLNTTVKETRHVPAAQLQEALRVAADARLLDVYAGAHLTIFMIDPRQRASWDYAKQETLHVPPTCCVLYALNFLDVDTDARTASVSLEEVQAWCGRVRRSTTSVVHRMLEGRQASEEFSVRPMTAVLSALSGAGIIGVIRALHVASTLLRIETEEVRIARLFELIARQQAVSIGDDATPQQHPAPKAVPTMGNGCSEQWAAISGKTSMKQQTGGQRQVSTLNSVQCTNDYPSPAVHQALAKSASPPATGRTPELRMEHRTTTSSRAGLDNELLLSNQHPDAAPPRALTEAETMRLFLGSGSSGGSNASSRSSRSSSFSTAGRPFGGRTGAAMETRGVLSTCQPLPSKPNETLPTAAMSLSSRAEAPHDHTLETAKGSAELEDSSVAVHTARPLDEEVMRALATTMVHDAEVPADDFFQEEGGSNTDLGGNPALPSSVPAKAGVSPLSSSPESTGAPHSGSPARFTEKTHSLRACPLWTQRVVHKASTAPSLPLTSDTGAVFQNEVSTILAQMTAALSASTPQEDGQEGDSAAAAEGAHPRNVRCTGEVTSERHRKKRSSKHHSVLNDSTSGRHERSRHRKHRNHCSTADGQCADQAESMVDDGSFELVVM
ncbi:hypothetical protein ABL78_0275 [Leptomonas seymouri]|uniref:Uncharacterized protein n=1 Tax=Leptomonas seymouri TaxID=5684 RepID=A0A0N1IAD4_LEPSE|nr:hypothetical protein ABL78_0275 [Leptomonas seymouri]|eukprot:KPI90515.1 hypothetical protein ABL78_0275 [Leptomonas seymouri]